MILRITAKKTDGFCRAGKHHPAESTDHKASKFTPEQIEALKAEPMLVVQEIPEEGDGEDNGNDAKAAKDKKDKGNKVPDSSAATNDANRDETPNATGAKAKD